MDVKGRHAPRRRCEKCFDTMEVVLLASFTTQSLSCCFEVLVPAHALQLLGVGAAEWANIRLGKSVAVALAMCVLGGSIGGGGGGGGGGAGGGGGCATTAARRRAALATAALGTLALAALACALLGAASRACFGVLFPLAGALNSAAAVQLQALTQLLSTAVGGGRGSSLTLARGNMWLRLSGSLAALLLPLVLSSLTLAAALPFLLAASAACAAAGWLRHRPAVAAAASAMASAPARDLGVRSSDPARGVGGWGAGGLRRLLLLLRGAGAFVSQRTILAPSEWSARRAPLSRLVCCAAASSALVGTVLQSYAFFHLTAAAAAGGNPPERSHLGMQLSVGAFGALHSATAALGMLSIAAHARLAALPAVGAKRCAVGSTLACALCAAGLGRATSAANAAAWYAAALALHKGVAVPLTMWVAMLSDRGEQLGAAAKQKVAAAAFNATCVTAAGALLRAGLSSRAIFGVVGAACAANAMLLARIPGTRRIAAAATPEPGAAVAAAAAAATAGVRLAAVRDDERSTKTKTKTKIS